MCLWPCRKWGSRPWLLGSVCGWILGVSSWLQAVHTGSVAMENYCSRVDEVELTCQRMQDTSVNINPFCFHSVSLESIEIRHQWICESQFCTTQLHNVVRTSKHLPWKAGWITATRLNPEVCIFDWGRSELNTMNKHLAGTNFGKNWGWNQPESGKVGDHRRYQIYDNIQVCIYIYITYKTYMTIM